MIYSESNFLFLKIFFSVGVIFLFSNNIIVNNNSTYLTSQNCYTGNSSESNVLYFFNNLISNNTTSSYLINLSGQPSLYTNNNIFNNSSPYYLYNGNSYGSDDLIVENNYWGTTVESEIQTAIYDWYDNSSNGFVGYDPWLTEPNTDAPISPPANLLKEASGNSVVLTWDANPESDLAGYKIHYGNFTGYSYTTNTDLGNVTTYTLSGVSIDSSIAVTAYDGNIDGTDDQVEGYQSWFSFAGDPSPSMTLSASSLDFGAVQTSQSATLNVTIGNDGTADLTVTDITSSNQYYSVSPTAFTLAAGESQVVAVLFAPADNSDNGPVPNHFRESFRAAGPSAPARKSWGIA